MTIGDVITRVGAVLEASPFRCVETDDPFSFDRTAQTAIDGAYRIEAEMTGREGYLGMSCLEMWAVSVWLARAATRTPNTVRDALTVTVSSLSAALTRDALASGDYHVADVSGEVQWPDGSDDYLVGRMGAQLEFDRAL